MTPPASHGPGRKVLHVLSQRPSRTGSGVTLDSLVREAGAAGWQQQAVVGVPIDDPEIVVGDLDPAAIHPVRFGGEALPFPVAGMSDVMPYTSTRFSSMSDEQIAAYRATFSTRLRDVIQSFRPDVVHAHHLWIVGSMIKDVAANVPVVSHCHATGLRQMELCPRIAREVRRGVARNDRFVALHGLQADAIVDALGVERSRVVVVGAGYREDVFRRQESRRARVAKRIVYAGKLADAKGVPWLLRAFASLHRGDPELELWLAGSGGGESSRRIQAQIAETPGATALGALPPEELAERMRDSAVFVLPSLYEGLPLVLVEAAACGCRLVSTALPGVMDSLAAPLRGVIELVEVPRLQSVDQPDPADEPDFEAALAKGLEAALRAAPPRPPTLAPFTWHAVYQRIEAVWRELTSAP